MGNQLKSICLAVLLWMAPVTLSAQMTLMDAVRMAMMQNHQIQIAIANSNIAENNVKPGNAGLLPTVTAQGGYDVSRTTNNTEFAGAIPPIIDAQGEGSNYNLGLAVNYTLFDGLGSFRSYQRLKEHANLADMQTRISIESTVMQVVNAYYDLLRAAEQKRISASLVATSADRLNRLNASYEYGGGKKIDVLNAQVDYYADSSNYIINDAAWLNAKRRLNVLLGRHPGSEYTTTGDVTFTDLPSHSELRDNTRENSANLLLAETNLDIAELGVQANRSTFFPRIGLNATYGLNGSESNTSILRSNQSVGFTGGVSLTWNLFSGQTRSTNLQNAKLALESNQHVLEEARLKVENEFEAMYTAYQTSLMLVSLEEENIKVSNLNMQRTNDLYSNGQVGQLEFRQAQLNLMLAQSRLNQSLYSAKISEYELKRLAGRLIN